ncbi:MAG: hypothetical protein L0H53_06305 [Candidatus Nitrosocosmicus sp.]|nr:hypothetical protein [Candidatus Nitrosocosmicus sp.]
MINNRFLSVAILMAPFFVLCGMTNGAINELNLFTGFQEWGINKHQMAFGFGNNTMNMDLVINTSTLKIHDLNDNKFPDTGELSTVLGTLYKPETQNETGSYRASFIWGMLDNSTDGAPVSLGTQVFDIKDNGTIVVIGDIVTDSRVGSGPGISVPIPAAIAGGTDKYHGISGSTTTIERFYDPGKALFLNVTLDIIHPNGPK